MESKVARKLGHISMSDASVRMNGRAVGTQVVQGKKVLRLRVDDASLESGRISIPLVD